MKVLFNGLCLNEKPTGVQYYAENLLKALAKENNNNLTIEPIIPKNYKGSLRINNLKNINIDSSNRLIKIAFENIFLTHYYKKQNYNLYHSPNYVLPYFWNHPSVLTVHDLIALEYPEFCQKESVLYFKLLLSASIYKATQIIAVSNKIKEDIIKHFRILPETIHVIYHGINDHFKKIYEKKKLHETREKYNLPEKFILFVGNIEPKKNLERLIMAFYLLKKDTEIKHKLVIVGKNGWKFNEVYNTIRKLKIGSELIFTGYIPEEELPTIYSISDVFVFPSLYEGFGIPPLEAMACEVPVLISKEGALPEVTGCNCIKVNPYDVKDIAKGIYELISNKYLRERLSREGKIWAKNYTWSKAAKETLSLYTNTLMKPN